MKINKKLVQLAIDLVEQGLHTKHVAQALGISRQTFYNWLRKGEQTQKGLEYELYKGVQQAEARAIARNIAIIQKAAQDGNWQAAAWWLERKYPEEWGRKDRMNLETDNGLVIKVEKIDGTSGVENE
jgi:transposase